MQTSFTEPPNRFCDETLHEEVSICPQTKYEVKFCTHRSHYMCSQKAVCLLVTKDLDQTVGVIVALGTTVGQQREGAHFVLHTL